jgi:prepilin-type processing-associated H-X9-DG protein
VARFHNVSDGLSNTLLIGELAGRPDPYEKRRLVDAYPPDDPKSGMDLHAATWGISTHFVWLVGYAGVNTANHRGLYSFHDSGANAAFADGSVRFLSEATSLKTLGAMSTRAAGDLVTLP